MEPSEIESGDDFPITSALDNLILMHREIHFSGSFDLMLDYYRKHGKGTNPEFEISRIETLAETERLSGENMAAMFLSGAEAEKIAEARGVYKKLREICETPNPKTKIPGLIADLILSEDEEEDKAIEAIVQEKQVVVPSLIDLLRNEQFHDPLFPGYGRTPELAARCLGLIGDKRAIIALFEFIGRGDFFEENVALDALNAIGDPAKQFLLKVLHSTPINEDNERAAIALLPFKDDPEVAKLCWEIFKKLETRSYLPFATYLILVCEGLTSPEDKAEFHALMQNDTTPKSVRQDMLLVTKNW